jgi:hypothetical protein
MNSNRSSGRWGFLVVALLLALVPWPARAGDDPDTHMLEQFTITLPAGWFVHDQNTLMNRKGPFGVILFSPVDLGKIAHMSGSKEDVERAGQTFAEVSAGKIPSFFVDRHPAEKGCTCAEGFTKKGRKKLLDMYEDSARNTPNGRATVTTPEVQDVVVGGCKGLRIRMSSSGPSDGAWEYLIHAAADGTTTYDFSLRTKKEFFEADLPDYEKSIPTLVLNASRAH